MKLTDKPRSFEHSVVDSLPIKQKTSPKRGFYKEVKLTDKPRSFEYSVVDSLPTKQKPRRSGVL
ncbi:hypothetical protein B9P84_22110 [Citrobacter braakii]|nr:hypothetical protein B9P84_22110 [Citrobacter braakii]